MPNPRFFSRLCFTFFLLTSLPAARANPAAEALPPGPGEVNIGVSRLKPLKLRSGPVNYYTVIRDPGGDYIHSSYKWPLKTAVLAYEIPGRLRGKVARFSWKWRAVLLPKGGDECIPGRTDSAAVLYLVWRRGLRWYSLKYAWSAAGVTGMVCGRQRGLFSAQETIILESGPGSGGWRAAELDPDFEFRSHFAGGDPNADVPGLDGFGLMSDGDQTRSPSEADFGGFVLTYR